jgi:hypothetical protein
MVMPTATNTNLALSVTDSESIKEPTREEAKIPKFKDKEQAPPQTRKPRRKMDTKWIATLEELKAYKDLHGDCIVPRGYDLVNPRLASWVAEQRFVR